MFDSRGAARTDGAVGGARSGNREEGIRREGLPVPFVHPDSKCASCSSLSSRAQRGILPDCCRRRSFAVLGMTATSAACSFPIPRSRLLPSVRSEEHTSELQSLMRISYAVFCLTNKNTLQH